MRRWSGVGSGGEQKEAEEGPREHGGQGTVGYGSRWGGGEATVRKRAREAE